RASAPNALSRPASTEPAMIAARVANGPSVARAAGSRAAGRQQAAAAVRIAAAVHSTMGSRSRGDVILADASRFPGMTACMSPRMWLNLLADAGAGQLITS